MQNKNMLSIVIPSYNEQDNLIYLFESLDPVVAAHPTVEILIVDNGSTDDSAQVMHEEIQKRSQSNYKIVSVSTNIGYGFGILSGLRAASGNILAITHADRQTDPMDVIKALEIYESQNDLNLLVKGHRKKRRPLEAFFSFGMGLFASIATGARLTEINAQPKLMSRQFFEKIEAEAPNDFALDLYLLYKAKKMGSVIEFPVYFLKRVAGEAKGGSGGGFKLKWKLIKRSLSYILELRKSLN
jgi:glycosyltransferase involved in cell wall biosynthesis